MNNVFLCRRCAVCINLCLCRDVRDVCNTMMYKHAFEQDVCNTVMYKRVFQQDVCNIYKRVFMEDVGSMHKRVFM